MLIVRTRYKTPDYPEVIRVPVTEIMKVQLELEAWEMQKTLPEYIRGLLRTRGKFARTVGRGAEYLVVGPASPPKVDF
jgi:hypothetical protein